MNVLMLHVRIYVCMCIDFHRVLECVCMCVVGMHVLDAICMYVQYGGGGIASPHPVEPFQCKCHQSRRRLDWQGCSGDSK